MTKKKFAFSSGLFNLIDNIIRSHPIFYFYIRKIIRFTNIFEHDTYGVKLIDFPKKINIMDVGASDGIASKFFLRNLKVKKIYCFEPDKNYIKILKKIDRRIIVKPFAIGNINSQKKVYYPEFNFFGKKKIITYCFYDKNDLEQQINLDFKFKKNLKIIKENLVIKRINYINDIIDLIKIDVNGFEYFVIKGLKNIIKKDFPAILLESGKDINKINLFLKKFKYKQFTFSKEKNKFYNYKNKYCLNVYFLQKKHLTNL